MRAIRNDVRPAVGAAGNTVTGNELAELAYVEFCRGKRDWSTVEVEQVVGAVADAADRDLSGFLLWCLLNDYRASIDVNRKNQAAVMLHRGACCNQRRVRVWRNLGSRRRKGDQ